MAELSFSQERLDEAVRLILRRDMNKLASTLASMGASRPPDWAQEMKIVSGWRRSDTWFKTDFSGVDAVLPLYRIHSPLKAILNSQKITEYVSLSFICVLFHWRHTCFQSRL